MRRHEGPPASAFLRALGATVEPKLPLLDRVLCEGVQPTDSMDVAKARLTDASAGTYVELVFRRYAKKASAGVVV